jgi:CDP-glycerol glycerophosphotransferase (TagB/SpsB family)
LRIKRLLAIALYLVRKKGFSNRKIWVVGENNGGSAQDNGYIFYRYCRDHYPDQEVYFVSRLTDLYRQDDHVLLYDSFKHYLYSCGACVIIRTHALRDVIAGRVFNRISKTKKHVFLQHGVIGFKNIEKHYGKWTNKEDFVADLFVTSSQYEKNIITHEFQYSDEEVIVTGLPRHDYLVNEIVADPREILVIPTWREWTRKRFSFLESNYYRNFNGLIRNKRLQDLLRENNVIINFYPHINMHGFIGYFDTSNPYVNVVRKGEKTVQDMIKSCSLMVTDYSSVSFEMLSLEKPVVFYQYDRQAFF